MAFWLALRVAMVSFFSSVDDVGGHRRLEGGRQLALHAARSSAASAGNWAA
jgi:hypothetical protein